MDGIEEIRGFAAEPLPIHVVYPQTRHLAAKLRAFVDFLAQRARVALRMELTAPKTSQDFCNR
jgi:DNA-binding transcriptional LysR family regulator